MKSLFIILSFYCCLTAAQAQPRQPRSADSIQARVDSLENQAISYLGHKDDSSTSSVSALAAQGLLESLQIGYNHGIAVALVCQAYLMNNQANDFTRSERLARESLVWFGQTDNKRSITLAYNATMHTTGRRAEDRRQVVHLKYRCRRNRLLVIRLFHVNLRF